MERMMSHGQLIAAHAHSDPSSTQKWGVQSFKPVTTLNSGAVTGLSSVCQISSSGPETEALLDGSALAITGGGPSNTTSITLWPPALSRKTKYLCRLRKTSLSPVSSTKDLSVSTVRIRRRWSEIEKQKSFTAEKRRLEVCKHLTSNAQFS